MARAPDSVPGSNARFRSLATAPPRAPDSEPGTLELALGTTRAGAGCGVVCATRGETGCATGPLRGATVRGTLRGATTEGEAGAGTPVAGRGVSCGLGFGVTEYAGFTVREGSVRVPGRAGAGVVGTVLSGSTRGVGLDHPDRGVAGRATGCGGVTARFSGCRGETIGSRPFTTLAGSDARDVFCGSSATPHRGARTRHRFPRLSGPPGGRAGTRTDAPGRRRRTGCRLRSGG